MIASNEIYEKAYRELLKTSLFDKESIRKWITYEYFVDACEYGAFKEHIFDATVKLRIEKLKKIKNYE